MNHGAPQVCHHCKQPGHFIRDCQLRQIPNVAALLGGNRGDANREPAPQDIDGLLPAPNAIVPYRAPAANGGRREATRTGSNQGYGITHNGWWAENREREKEDKFNRVWSWYSEEMDNKEREKQAREQKLREEEELKKLQQVEEERSKAKKEREDFERSIGRMVKDNMKEVCDQVLGKKAGSNQGTTVGISSEAQSREWENRWRKEDAAAREQIERQRIEEEVDRQNERMKS
ncbi:hypothetical protein CBR_g3108 [Chara braunii]|uniref:CCHC-type domain-containing protein n=1 Tax=Chara braunii TaxID=69332 RepID=A0A388KF38_CHABU|nr:hypothetical protein CBR_g3108 [Chara braunii]|eukprot:GBG68563.1 hypothetical protein CBR_g3108 [Chara braunii]